MDQKFLHCPLQKDNNFEYNLTRYLNSSWIEGVSASDPKAVGFGAVTGIIIAIVIDGFLSFQFTKSSSASSLQTEVYKKINVKTLSRTLLLTLLVLILPLLSLFLILALVYKVLCSVLIKRKDKYFVGFLDSFDVFWSLEDDATKSVINVLGIIESDSPFAIANNIKEKLESIVTNDASKKIFYRRNEKYGFYYWQSYKIVDMNQYVEVVEFPQTAECNDVANLETLMSKLQEQALPYKDEGLFKILITRQRVGNYKEERGDYGIIFRIHHSVGDGVALIEFLCQTFADKRNSCPNMFSIPESCNYDSPNSLITMMQKLLDIPVCFVDGILRKPDDNSLHGPTLMGKKVFKWTESDENLLKLVKEIKENVNQLNFTDVLLTALSSGLRSFLDTVPPIPEDVAVILPVRCPKMSKVENDSILKNEFSVTILDVPVEERGNINKIKQRCNTLRQSADPLTNYYFLKLVCSILPKKVLQPLLNSSQATMVFSNMPGPEQMTICGGNVLKSLVFFVPHKGNTGLGVTALCYGGVLRFAAMADEALVSGPEDLDRILQGMVEEIKRLHQLCLKLWRQSILIQLRKIKKFSFNKTL